ncbi:MAG: 2-hydroxyacyl-CoA dehydratase [Spirochaetaceae bacterium]|jgi:bcr-type benzoyl-CoA reductase subunit C|nr:2-hydroxyacyl-CoA dehydratase [Spirochaetaceae bacterium]
MAKIQELTAQFRKIAASPEAQADSYIAQGKKLVGCFPYYVPEELVHAGGMVPFGVWGAQGTVKEAKKYFAPFYCTIAQMGLELGLTGKLNKLSAVIIPSLCDTLRPLTQNFRVGVPQIPFIFLAHPQNRKPEYGLSYTLYQYTTVKAKLEKIAGGEIELEKVSESIKVYNESRKTRREFVLLAGQHPEAVSAADRSAVLKSAFFMLKEEHTALLRELNGELAKLPTVPWKGVRVLTSGILADSPGLLKIFDDLKIAIVADDVAQESRAIRVDAPEDGDPMKALARQFASQDNDTILYDPTLTGRPKFVADLAKKSGAQGVVILMQQFCDPEEMEYPSLKKALEEANLPHAVIGVDQQMRDFAQARTQLQTLREMLG